MEAAPHASHRAHCWLAVCFTVLLAAAFAYGAACLARAPLVWQGRPLHAWLDGEAEASVGRGLNLPFDTTLRTLEAALRYRLLGDLGPQVNEGCPGWLFYHAGLQPAAQADAAFAARQTLLHRYAQVVQSRGAQLLVVTVPDKARIEADALCSLHQDASLQARLDRWQATLGAGHIAHVDLRAALTAVRPAGFYRTDVHWNEQGAAAAADAVASAALTLLGSRGDTAFSTTTAASARPRVGDLIVLAGLEHAAGRWRPTPDQSVSVSVQPVHSGGLLDAPPPPEVMIVGSSFSRRSNFTERVGQRIGREIWNRSIDGGQFSDALQGALDAREPWPASVRLVIWELSEQALSSALSDSERKALTQYGLTAGRVMTAAPAKPAAPAGANHFGSRDG